MLITRLNTSSSCLLSVSAMVYISDTSEREAIYHAVGKALDAWTKVEIAIEPLFACLSDADELKAKIAMASIVSFQARLDVCNSLVAQSHASRELRLKWHAITKRMSKKYKRRNEIAHFSVIDWRNADTGAITTCLIPYWTSGSFIKKHAQQFEKVMLSANKAEADQHLRELPSFSKMGLSSLQILDRSVEFEGIADEVRAIVTEFEELQKQLQAERASILRQHNLQSDPDA